ncbi:hypothetical protein BD413DRAFT_560142 [Trametes elegans]|nr:hypothetical protein BD413DRAFT_560142 [Trametes elegans]
MNNMVVFKGDISPAIQQQILAFSDFHIRDINFAHSIGEKVMLKEVEVSRRTEDNRLQARVVYQLKVEDDMLNQAQTMHGGCAAFLLDVCPSVPLALLAMIQDKPADYTSQAMVMTFHAPAPRGATLNVMNTTVSLGSRTVSARAEIWDVTHRRLCVSGVLSKMAPKNATPPVPGAVKL